jgi:hypothetical protein
VDAPSYDPQFAIHEEDDKSPPQAFPGSRFGQWNEGRTRTESLRARALNYRWARVNLGIVGTEAAVDTTR